MFFHKDLRSVDSGRFYTAIRFYRGRIKGRLIYFSRFDANESGHRDIIMNTANEIKLYRCWQPAATWVNTTRYCKYSQVLLMMGENVARNM